MIITMHRIVVLLVIALLAGCSSSAKIELRAASAEPVAEWRPMTVRWDKERMWVSPTAFITNNDIARVSPGEDASARRVVMIELNESGQAKMWEHTQAHVGFPVAVLVDGKLVAAPRLMSPLRQRAMISGLTESEIKRIESTFK